MYGTPTRKDAVASRSLTTATAVDDAPDTDEVAVYVGAPDDEPAVTAQCP